MNKALLFFVKITGFPIQHFYFKKKVYFEDKKATLKCIKAGALCVSNHTSIYDYVLIMYTFFSRCIHTLAAEILYSKNKLMSWFLNSLGFIKVDRSNYNFSFINETVSLLKKRKTCLIFPQSRLPNEHEKDIFLPFKTSYVYIALQADCVIIPIYTNGIYGKKKKEYKDRARLIVGKPLYLNLLYDKNKSDKENIEYINKHVENYILKLKEKLDSLVCEKGK